MLDKLNPLASATTASAGLGLRLVAFEPLRLATAMAGVAVAVLVMFVQLGLLSSILESQAGIATLLRGDLIVMHASRTNLHVWGDIDRIRLSQTAAFDGVDQVLPIYEGGVLLRNPPDPAVHRIIAFAFPPRGLPMDIGDSAAIESALKNDTFILFDRLSRPIYGPIRPGRSVELDGLHYNIAGLVSIGPDIIMDGAVVMSESAWLSKNPGTNPIMGVVRLKPGASVEVVKQRLLRELPADVSVLTPREAYVREIEFTLRSAPIGIIFGSGLVAGVIIGAIICYQILFNEIIDRAKEYATLGAMGFAGSFFRRIVFEQALVLAFGGFCIGLLAALFTEGLLASATGMQVLLGLPSVMLISLPTLAMAFLAAMFAQRHLATAEPADLY